ncbi:SPOR domain-containing protein [Cryomorpha ignava]|uniref:SPOR domain-containing protein n=1 Tax=Cryomorpha ignava TaxID=101383 RepID=A0A7K3WMJ8_9FLAO|nr:SPOR domain-containing protein [Cryomorpha ignava]NEN21925.1 SPOR domain-containing protein [Cryomorpha ignava]
MEIDKYIQELLYDYDCVIVPQLGGFVTNYRPAVADLNSGIGHPPGKDIRFNKNLTKSDGLLERAVADGAKISFEDAGIVLKDISEKYWSKLNGGAKVQFKRIGVLYIDDHKNLRFEPAADQNYLKASFGLDSFTLPAITEMTQNPDEEKKPTPVIPIERAEPETIRFKSNKSIYWVAAATILPFVAMSVYLGVSTNFKSPTEITLAELIPFGINPAEAVKFTPRATSAEAKPASNDTDGTGFPENTAVFPFSFETNTVDSSGVWINLNEEKKPFATPEEVSPSKSKLTGTYHIIAGCFGEEVNAKKFVNNLKDRGYKAAILDYHKKLHRVRLESFTDYSTALSTLQELRNDGTFPNAWLLKKPLS